MPSKNLVQVIGYIRVSRVGGRSGASFISPVEQRRAIERLAVAKGLRIIDWLEELDQSGGNAERPKWNVAREMIRQGEAAGIVVYNFSRWSRDTEHGLGSVRLIREAGGEIWSCQEDFDTRSPTGWAMLTNFFAFAQLQREQARESFATSTANAIERGVWMAAKVPFGYRKVDKRLMPDPATAPLVREMFERRTRSESATETMRWLTKLGYPLGRTTVRDICENEAYLGVTRQGDVRNERAHEPLVSRELFDQAQAARGIKPIHTGALSNVGMLGGIVRCATCGSAMPVTWTQGAAGPDGKRLKIPAYACTARNKGGCTATGYIQVAALDAYVDDLMCAVLRADAPAAQIEAVSNRLREANDRHADAQRALAELQAFDYTTAGMSLESQVAMVKNAEAREGMARAELANVRNESDVLGLDGEQRVPWGSIPTLKKRLIMHSFLSRVIVSPAHGKRGIPVADRVQVIDMRDVLMNWVPTPENCDATITHSDGSTVRVPDDKFPDLCEQYNVGVQEGRVHGIAAPEFREAIADAWAAHVQREHPDSIVKRALDAPE